MDRDRDEQKPSTRGFVSTSKGRRVKVDELDMAVLNIGHGAQPMTPDQFKRPGSPFIRPVYNVDFKDDLKTNPRQDSPVNNAHQVFGDANNPQTIRQSTGLSKFAEIHAVNPYAYDPLTAARTLLAPHGSLHVTGTKSNPFAQPITSDTTSQANIGTREQKNLIPVQRISPTNADLSGPNSTLPGTMHPVHGGLSHQSSGGNALSTKTSQTHTYRNQATHFRDVTPSQDSLTRSNTIQNASLSQHGGSTPPKRSTSGKRVTFHPSVSDK